LHSVEGISNRLEAVEATCTALCARLDGNLHATPCSTQERVGLSRVDVRLSPPTTAVGVRPAGLEAAVPGEPLPKNGSAHEPDDASHSAISSATVPPHCDVRNAGLSGTPRLHGRNDASTGSVINTAVMASPSEACVIQEPDRHGVCKPARGSFHLEAALPLSTVPSISPRISGLQTAPVGQAAKVATSTMVQQTVGSCYTPTPTSMTDSLGAVQTAKSHSYQPIPSGGGPSAWTSRRSVSPLRRTEPSSTVMSPQLLQVEGNRAIAATLPRPRSAQASGTPQVLLQQQQQQQQQHHPQPWGVASTHLRGPPPPSVGSVHSASQPVWVQTVQAPATRSCSPAQHVRRASSAGALVRLPPC